MSIFHISDKSLTLDPGDGGALSAYIVDERNRTTARTLARDGKVMQVTFLLAPPPSVSCFTDCCTNGAPTEFTSEPELVTTEDLKPRMSRYNLYTYDSLSMNWDRKTAVLADQQYKGQLATHDCSIVINIGGDDHVGTMGWVDLEQGIILCDVLGGKEDSPTSRLVRYIPLPDAGPVKKKNILRGTTRRYRTIAAVHGRIQCVEVQIHFRPGPRPRRLHGTYFSAGWTIVRWSRSTTAAAGSSGWRKDCQLSSSDITAPADMAALLPTLPRDIDEDATTLERLHVGHPTISLGDDSDIVYFMAKIDEMEKDAWVIAVDLKKKVLQGVTEFAPRCVYSMDFTYMPTTISKYLTPANM